jgi:hypothetical protein
MLDRQSSNQKKYESPNANPNPEFFAFPRRSHLNLLEYETGL